MSKTKNKILIVEDDNFLLNMYSNKFEMENFEVFMAGDGKRALNIALKENPQVILLDIMLPRMDGFKFLKEIKKDKAAKKIPIILLTNLSQKDDIEKAFNLGVDDYLIKAHFMPSEVIEKVKGLIK